MRSARVAAVASLLAAACFADSKRFHGGVLGFTTGTGGETDSIAIRNVHGRFLSCTP